MDITQKIIYEILTKARKAINHLHGGTRKTRLISNVNVNISQEETNQLIIELLESQDPCMITRFGSTELNCVIDYLNSKTRNKHISYLTGKIDSFCFTKSTIKSIMNLSGVFPNDTATLIKFSELILEDIKYIDLLGSWLEYERRILDLIPDVPRAEPSHIMPYCHENPWSNNLENKNILVIHPFSRSIESQYLKRGFLFRNPKVLPNFKLQVYQSIQSLGGESKFKNWFDALEFMKHEIDQIEFEIAIIGCGAYGMPLAAHIKRTGKKAIHLCGTTQLLFGIMGKRWETGGDELLKLINIEHWTRPLPEERPKNYHIVENGCYW